jgi:phage protein U
MYSQLGNIRFQGIFSPNSAEKDAQTIYAEHALIGGKPRLQQTGQGADTLRLAMKFHRSFCTPETEIDRLDAHRIAGDSLRYVTGTGRLVGNFVIQNLKVSPIAQAPNGLLIEVDVEVSLLENAYSNPAAEAIAAGFAMAGNTPVEVVSPIAPLSPVGVASQGALEINAGTGALAASLEAAQTGPGSTASTLLEARATAQNMMASATASITAVNTTVLNVYDQTRFFEQNANEVLDALEVFEQACADGNLQNAVDAFVNVSNGNSALMTSSEVLERLSGARIPIVTNG